MWFDDDTCNRLYHAIVGYRVCSILTDLVRQVRDRPLAPSRVVRGRARADGATRPQTFYTADVSSAISMEHYDVRVGLDGNLGARLRVAPSDSDSGVAVVEHTLGPGKLAAPLHRHTHEDEISFIVAGTMGVQEGDAVSEYGTGEVAVKERDTWHTFWNPGSDTLRFLEIIAPGAFAGYFAEVAALRPDDGEVDPETRADLATLHEAYDLDIDPESVPDLLERHGLER